MKSVIVTGGAGFIGSNLVNLLLEKGLKVVVIDDLSVGKKENLPIEDKKLQFVKADIRVRKDMLKLIKNVDTIFHLATQCVRKSINNPWLVHSVNAEGTLSVLDASLANKISSFVYVSSSEVYGTAEKTTMTEDHPLNPTTIYGASKLCGELYSLAYWRTHGLNSIIVRPFNTYGYNSHFDGAYAEVIPRFVIRALNGLPLQIFGDGTQTRDFTFVTDTAYGIYLVGSHGKPGQVYNIARGQEVSVVDLAKIVLKVLGLNGEIEFLHPRPGDVKRHNASITRAALELDFEAKYGIVAGVKEYVNWVKKNYPNPKEILKYYEETNW